MTAREYLEGRGWIYQWCSQDDDIGKHADKLLVEYRKRFAVEIDE